MLNSFMFHLIILLKFNGDLEKNMNTNTRNGNALFVFLPSVLFNLLSSQKPSDNVYF